MAIKIRDWQSFTNKWLKWSQLTTMGCIILREESCFYESYIFFSLLRSLPSPWSLSDNDKWILYMHYRIRMFIVIPKHISTRDFIRCAMGNYPIIGVIVITYLQQIIYLGRNQLQIKWAGILILSAFVSFLCWVIFRILKICLGSVQVGETLHWIKYHTLYSVSKMNGHCFFCFFQGWNAAVVHL